MRTQQLGFSVASKVMDNTHTHTHTLGWVVHELAIGASPGQEVWDTRGTAAGSYMVELYNAGRLLDAQRVVVKP